jgi:hypothetical protein
MRRTACLLLPLILWIGSGQAGAGELTVAVAELRFNNFMQDCAPVFSVENASGLPVATTVLHYISTVGGEEEHCTTRLGPPEQGTSTVCSPTAKGRCADYRSILLTQVECLDAAGAALDCAVAVAAGSEALLSLMPAADRRRLQPPRRRSIWGSSILWHSPDESARRARDRGERGRTLPTREGTAQ